MVSSNFRVAVNVSAAVVPTRRRRRRRTGYPLANAVAVEDVMTSRADENAIAFNQLVQANRAADSIVVIVAEVNVDVIGKIMSECAVVVPVK